jgi:hypothetical protein
MSSLGDSGFVFFLISSFKNRVFVFLLTLIVSSI